MRTALVILCRNQERYAPAIARGVLSQSVRPDRVLVVMDRPGLLEKKATEKAYADVPGCEFLAVSDLPERIERPPMVDGIAPFCAGRCRNLAMEMLYDVDLAVFIDGDCIPMPRMLEAHVAAYQEGCVTVGRRIEAKWGSEDQRQCSSKHPIPIFGKEPGTVTSERYIADSGVVWTCNVGITPGAAGMVRELNRELYGVPAVFHPDFGGRWGGEDGFLGMECFYLGIPIRTTPVLGGDGVSHIAHPRPAAKYDLKSFVAFLEEKRRELVTLMEAAGKYAGEFRSLPQLLEEEKCVRSTGYRSTCA